MDMLVAAMAAVSALLVVLGLGFDFGRDEDMSADAVAQRPSRLTPAH